MQLTRNGNIIEVVFDTSLSNNNDQVEEALKVQKEILSIYNESPDESFGILFDLTKPELLISTSSFKAIKVYEEILNYRQTTKIAVLGKDSFVEKLLNILMANKPGKKVNWFVMREEALMWLT